MYTARAPNSDKHLPPGTTENEGQGTMAMAKTSL
jgi:hypothetical protein